MDRKIVIKLGGSILQAEKRLQDFVIEAEQLLRSNVKLLITHGGGPEIEQNLIRHNLPSHFHQGLRVTDPATMAVVEASLCGITNRQLVGAMLAKGLQAVGLSGKDGAMARVRPLANSQIGWVGEVVSFDPTLVELLWKDYIPILAPVCFGEGHSWNVNADSFTSSLAGKLKVDTLIFVTDVAGIKISGVVQPRVTAQQIIGAIESGEISGGMIPKAEALLEAQKLGISSTTILSADAIKGLAAAIQNRSLPGTTLQA